MPAHKFKVRDIVALTPAVSRNVPRRHLRSRQATAKLMANSSIVSRAASEPRERVVRESELTNA